LALAGDVGSGVERLFVGRHDDGQRPPAATGHHLADGHINLVDVGSFLAVDLDVDEGFVHQRRHLWVLEALVLHHVAPVAGGVSDREEDRFVLLRSLGKGLGSPRPPVDRVVRVLEQVGALGFSEPVLLRRWFGRGCVGHEGSEEDEGRQKEARGFH